MVTGRVDIAELELAGGVVALDGLHWEATFRRGEEPSGAFTIGGATSAACPIPTQDASDVVAAVNGVLSQLGLVLTPPRSPRGRGHPLRRPDPARHRPEPNPGPGRRVTFAALQPLREQLFGALLAASCDSAAAITVIDILLGSFTGGGSLTLNIGGTQARFGEGSEFDGFGTGGEGQPPSVGAPAAAPRLGARRPPLPHRPVEAPPRPAEEIQRAPASGDRDTKSDGALAVGLGVLVMGAALAEADRRKMRQAGSPSPARPHRPRRPPQDDRTHREHATRSPIWHRLLRGVRAVPPSGRADARHGRVRALPRARGRRAPPRSTTPTSRRAGESGGDGGDRRSRWCRHQWRGWRRRHRGHRRPHVARAAGVQPLHRSGRADPRRPLLAHRASPSSGDNGGTTHTGVTGTEIHLAIRRTQDASFNDAIAGIVGAGMINTPEEVESTRSAPARRYVNAPLPALRPKDRPRLLRRPGLSSAPSSSATGTTRPRSTPPRWPRRSSPSPTSVRSPSRMPTRWPVESPELRLPDPVAGVVHRAGGPTRGACCPIARPSSRRPRSSS